MKRLLNSLVHCAFILCCIVAISVCSQPQRRRGSRYLIPEGYVGWVKISFLVKDAPALRIEDGLYLFKVPSNGGIITASDIEYGAGPDEFYHYSGDSRQKLKVSGWSGGGMVWGQSNGSSQGPNNERLKPVEYFFVGTEEQFKKCGSEKDKDYLPKVGPIDKAVIVKCMAAKS